MKMTSITSSEQNHSLTIGQWKNKLVGCASNFRSKAICKMFKTDEKTKEKLYEKFGRTKQSVDEDVVTIKHWLKTQLHLPEIMEDAKIRNFLNLNKMNIDKTKKKIDMYYTFRSLMPEIFGKSPAQLKELKMVFENTYLGTIPKALDDVYRVYFIKMKHEDCMDAVAYTNAWFTIFDIRLSEDFMVSDVIVYDWKNTTFADLKNFAAVVPKIITIYEKVFSFRLKRVLYINAPPYIATLMALLKSLMRPKIFERIEVHVDDSILAKMLPKDLIPKDYGGVAPSLETLTETMLQKFVEYNSQFEYLETLTVKEDLRPEKLTNDEILGYYGNFKQITLD